MLTPPTRVLHQGFLPVAGTDKSHVWKFSLEYGGRRPRHFHAEPELNLIVAGSATFGIGDTIVRVSAGELLGFPPGQDHILLETSPDLYLFAIGVSSRFSAEVLGHDRDSTSIPMHVKLLQDDFEALATRAETIVDREGVDPLGAELWEHAHWVQKKCRRRVNSDMHVLTRRTLSLLADSPSLERDQLAHQLRASPTSISRYFHHDTGMTLVKYRTRLRLLRFIHHIDQGRDDFSTLSKLAGFGSYSQCHRVFQTELGCSPRQFFASHRHDMQSEYEP